MSANSRKSLRMFPQLLTAAIRQDSVSIRYVNGEIAESSTVIRAITPNVIRVSDAEGGSGYYLRRSVAVYLR